MKNLTEQLRDQFCIQAGNQVEFNVWIQVHNQVWNQIVNQVEYQVLEQVNA